MLDTGKVVINLATGLDDGDPGTGFVTALAERDFPRLAETLTPDVRIRALIPPGPIELSGADMAAAKFASWFADAEEFELIRSGSDTVADRLHVFYRVRVKKPGDLSKIVEQHLLCALEEGRISALDLVCTGFRPYEAGSEGEADQGGVTPPPRAAS
jgi:hypothetical protein